MGSKGGDDFAKCTLLITSDCVSVFLMGKKYTAETRFAVALAEQENLKCSFLLRFFLFYQRLFCRLCRAEMLFMPL